METVKTEKQQASGEFEKGQEERGRKKTRLRLYANGAGELRLLNVKQTSRYLNIHEQTVYLWARTGRLPFLKLGRVVRFDKLVLDQWIRRKIEENEAKLLPWAEDGCVPPGVPEPPFDYSPGDGGNP